MQMSRWLVLSWKYLWRSVREFSNTSIFLHVYDLSLNTHARFGYGAPDYLKEEVERIQKRALRIIHPYLSYREVMKLNGIQSLSQRRNDIAMYVIFQKTSSPQTQVARTSWLTWELSQLYWLRNDNHVNSIDCKTNRFRNSFLPSSILAYNASLS
jgi:hypothetical protein